MAVSFHFETVLVEYDAACSTCGRGLRPHRDPENPVVIFGVVVADPDADADATMRSRVCARVPKNGLCLIQLTEFVGPKPGRGR